MTDYRYASGEEPRAGDIVRSLADKPAGPRKTGDVFTVQKTSPYRNGVYYAPCTHGKTATFELIARAGEPVRYQPGDVVELIDVAGAVVDVFGGTKRLPGYRYTLCDPAYAPNGSGSLHYVDTYNGGHKTWAPASYFKLVHRPAKTEPLVFTPPEPQVGDRVRVTFEAKVRHAHESGNTGLKLKGGLFSTPISAKEMAQAKIEIIERAEKPLAVGDRVRSYRAEFAEGEIIGLRGDKAWVEVNPDRTYTTFVSNMERVR